MKKILFSLVLIMATVAVNAQYSGVIRALNDANVIGEIKRDGNSLKMSDSLARIYLAGSRDTLGKIYNLIRSKDSSTDSRRGVVILNTVPISGTVTSTSDSSTGSRKGVVLLTNPTVTNDSSTMSRRNVQVTNTVTVSGTVTSSDSTTASRKGVVVLNTVPISGTVTSSDSTTASRKGVVLLTNPTIANTTFASTQSGTWTISNDSAAMSRRGVVLLQNPTIANTTFSVTPSGTFSVTATNDSSTLSRRNVQVTNSVTVSGHDSTTDSRKGVVLLSNPTVTNDSSTLSRRNVQVTNTVTVSGTVTSSDSTTASRKGVVLLSNPTITNTTFSVTPSGTFSVTATNDSTTMGRKNVQVTNTVATSFTRFKASTDSITVSLDPTDSTNLSKSIDSIYQRKAVVLLTAIPTGNNTIGAVSNDSTTLSRKFVSFTRLKSSTDTVAIAGSITATSGATAIYDSTWSATSLDTTGIGALASSQTVGWRSDTVGIRWRKCSDYKIGIKLTMANTAPANDKTVYVYLNPWFTTDGGTTWYSSDQGTTTLPTAAKGSSTIAIPNDLILLGALSYTTQNMTLQRSFTISQAYGSTMPDAFSLVIVNYSGAAIGTSSNIISVQPVNKVQR